jgi:hypothetical protein
MKVFVDTLSLRLALAGTLATASACSLRYDTDDLRGVGGGNDSGVYEGPDAAPGALHLQAVFPYQVLEGEGYAADPEDVADVRPIPVVLAGAGFTPDSTIIVEGEGFDRQELQAIVSSDGTWAAFELRIPIDTERDAGARPLTITVEKDDEQQDWDMGRQMLAELEQVDGTIDTDQLVTDTYSVVNLAGAVSVTGSRPLRLLGVAGITASAIVSGDAPGQAPGPGGCPGGAIGVPADCGPGSGGEGQSAGLGLAAGGGGGGGFGAGAQPGAGNLGGAQGGLSGRDSLVPLPVSDAAIDNRGAGGGGGGQILSGARAGTADASTGGGSGGVIELTSPGVVDLTGLVSVNGATGGECGALTLVTGGGGGGSGGAILVRAGTRLDGNAMLQALGGSGGSSDAACAGGQGGVGRVRIDRPGPDMVSTDPPAFIGPAFAAGLPVVTREPRIPVAITGNDLTAYRLRVLSLDPADGTERENVVQEPVTISNGVGEAMVTLFAGHNRLCAEADPEAKLSDLDAYRESQNCQSIAYIPE